MQLLIIRKRKEMVEGQQQRPRGKSAADKDLFSGDLSIEDLTVMKLMEEIMEFDQEIKMK